MDASYNTPGTSKPTMVVKSPFKIKNDSLMRLLRSTTQCIVIGVMLLASIHLLIVVQLWNNTRFERDTKHVKVAWEYPWSAPVFTTNTNNSQKGRNDYASVESNGSAFSQSTTESSHVRTRQKDSSQELPNLQHSRNTAVDDLSKNNIQPDDSSYLFSSDGVYQTHPHFDIPPLHPPSIPQHRHERFPSIEERVKMYMTDWYLPPCHHYDDGFVKYKPVYDGNISNIDPIAMVLTNEWTHTMQIKTQVQFEKFFSATTNHIKKAYQDRIFAKSYIGDLYNSMLPKLEQNQTIYSTTMMSIPLNFVFGDVRKPPNLASYPNLPHFKKFRKALTREQWQHKTTHPSRKQKEQEQQQQQQHCYDRPRPILLDQPHMERQLEGIIWKLNSIRHYAPLSEVQNSDSILSWHEKRPQAIWRGKLTGPRVIRYPSQVATCIGMPRCHLVYQYANSTLVNVKFNRDTPSMSEFWKANNMLDTNHTMTIPDMLQWKAIIVVEGNDVATSLKWALLSNSVVLMTPPTKATYAMEDQLIPWIHFIPLQEDFRDVEDKMLWILDHDHYAQRIAQRATLWMHDLLFHEQSKHDHEAIEYEILQRYISHFRYDESLPTMKNSQ